MELIKKELWELSELVRKKEVKPSEIVEELLNRIEETEKKINAYITVSEKALDEAKRCDEELAKLNFDEIPELFGLPISI